MFWGVMPSGMLRHPLFLGLKLALLSHLVDAGLSQVRALAEAGAFA